MPKRNKRRKQRRGKPGCLAVFLRSGAVLVLAVGAASGAFYAAWAMIYDLEQVGSMPQRSIVYDMNGEVYGYLHGENRVVVPIEKVSEHFQAAIIAREDSRFYLHPGIDPVGIARALVRNIQHRSLKEGGSTITQQLARNSFPLGGKTLHRKILEAMVALRIEWRYSKDEILEHYVNRIYFGSGLYGVEAASRAYFDKPASSLSVSEGAVLAGLIRSPTRFSPFNNLEDSIRERNTVLDRMADTGAIKRQLAESAKKWPLQLNSDYRRSGLNDYALDAIVRDLDVILAEQKVDEGGLRIYTTIDPGLMRSAERALDGHLREIESRSGFPHPPRSSYRPDPADSATPYLQGAVVAIDNRTGGIRALVGGRDYAESRYNRALLSKRQIGSAFKPFVYTAAFNRGLLPRTRISDARIAPGEIPSANPGWSPSNSDGKFGGYEPAQYGLIRSRNTMSVRVGELAGLDYVRHLATTIGLVESLPNGPAIFLGAFETTLKRLTTAYTLFPNNGLKRQPYLIERIDDPGDTPIYRAAHIKAQLLDPSVSWLTTSILEQVVKRGTAASAARLGVNFPAGGKTGTTNQSVDAWFVGFSSSLTCGVWVGMDQPKRIMAGGYGSNLALPVWADVMSNAPRSRYPAEHFDPPTPLRKASLCSVSSLLATNGCQSAGTAYSDRLPAPLVPTTPCNAHQQQIPRAHAADQERQGVLDTIKDWFR